MPDLLGKDADRHCALVSRQIVLAGGRFRHGSAANAEASPSLAI
jgi:hypothetical protein